MDKWTRELNLSKFPATLYCVALLVITSCTESPKVILTSQNNSHQLIYNCNNIQPQAESAEDIKTVVLNTPDVVKKLIADQKLVTLQSLSDASNRRDIRTIEFIIVRYLCEQKINK